MYLHLADGVLDLVEPRDFRTFKVVITASSHDPELAGNALSPLVSFLDEHTAWVDAAGLRAWPAMNGDPAWQDGITAMVEKARPHGWIDEQTGAIRAHVEWEILPGSPGDAGHPAVGVSRL